MSAHRFVEELRREGFLDEPARRLRLVRRDALFRRWKNARAHSVGDVPLRRLVKRDARSSPTDQTLSPPHASCYTLKSASPRSHRANTESREVRISRHGASERSRVQRHHPCVARCVEPRIARRGTGGIHVEASLARRDADFAFDATTRLVGDIAKVLSAAGFREALSGDHVPPVSLFQLHRAKLLICEQRVGRKRSQDILYINDTLALFAARLYNLRVCGVDIVRPTLSKTQLTQFVRSARSLFASLTDPIRDAARIASERASSATLTRCSADADRHR